MRTETKLPNPPAAFGHIHDGNGNQPLSFGYGPITWELSIGCSTREVYSAKQMHDYAEAAILADRERQAGEAVAWMPIETAPKDGTVILLCAEDQLFEGKARVSQGSWSAPSETPRLKYVDGFAPEPVYDDWEPYWASYDGGFTEEHPPTHWMPLPAAPGVASLPAPQAVQAGWKLVPVEPTPSMLVAMWEHRSSMTGFGENKIARVGYSAMLAAAPSLDGKAEQAEAPKKLLANLRDEIAMLERDRNYWRSRMQTAYEAKQGDVWYWQGDGCDHLESLVDSLPVVIRADALRSLIATQPTASNAGELPPLPQKFEVFCEDEPHGVIEGHTDEAMHAYAREAVRAALASNAGELKSQDQKDAARCTKIADATGAPPVCLACDMGPCPHSPASNAGEREAWSEHYDEIKATLTGAHGVMENLSAMERKVGPLGSHGRGYTHKITKALHHLESLRTALASKPPAGKQKPVGHVDVLALRLFTGSASDHAVKLCHKPKPGDVALYTSPQPENCDVRKILLDITPGLDGMGEEVYAKTIGDVEAKLGKMGEELEEWHLGIRRYHAAQPTASNAGEREIHSNRAAYLAGYEDALQAAGISVLVGDHHTPAALSHPSTPQGWQPIESAPVNTMVAALYRGQIPVIAMKRRPNDSPGGWTHAYAGEENFLKPNRGLTHWMPLPLPPEQGGKG